MDKLVEEKWQNGMTFTGTFVNERTINYITKYITKIDEDHKEFTGVILCSPGIGGGYLKRGDSGKHIYKKGETIETYRLRNGAKINLHHTLPVHQIVSFFLPSYNPSIFINTCQAIITP